MYPKMKLELSGCNGQLWNKKPRKAINCAGFVDDAGLLWNVIWWIGAIESSMQTTLYGDLSKLLLLFTNIFTNK